MFPATGMAFDAETVGPPAELGEADPVVVLHLPPGAHGVLATGDEVAPVGPDVHPRGDLVLLQQFGKLVSRLAHRFLHDNGHLTRGRPR